MAEHEDDVTGTDDNESNLVRDLRKQLKNANKELGDLRPYRDQRLLQQAGFDPDSKQGKALLRLHDGELTAEGLKATAEEYGFTPAEPSEPAAEPTVERSDSAGTVERIDALREAGAAPVGSQKLAYDDYQQMQQQDPAAAARELAAGRVVLPPHIAAVIQANRDDRASQIGA